MKQIFLGLLLAIATAASAQIVTFTKTTGGSFGIALSQISQGIEGPNGKITLLVGSGAESVNTTDTIESFMEKVGEKFLQVTATLPGGNTVIALNKDNITKISAKGSGSVIKLKTPVFSYNTSTGFSTLMASMKGNTVFSRRSKVITDTVNATLTPGHTIFDWDGEQQWTFTVTLPASPTDGDIVMVSFKDLVHHLTWSVDDGTISDGPTRADQDQTVVWEYVGGSTSTWFQLSNVPAFNEEYTIITDTADAEVDRGHTVFKHGTTQATFTVSLPSSPNEGDIAQITFNSAVTALTVDGGGISIIGTAITEASDGTSAEYKYIGGAVNKWARLR
jgi:hypothetical protein